MFAWLWKFDCSSHAHSSSLLSNRTEQPGLLGSASAICQTSGARARWLKLNGHLCRRCVGARSCCSHRALGEKESERERKRKGADTSCFLGWWAAGRPIGDTQIKWRGDTPGSSGNDPSCTNVSAKLMSWHMKAQKHRKRTRRVLASGFCCGGDDDGFWLAVTFPRTSNPIILSTKVMSPPYDNQMCVLSQVSQIHF